MLPCSALSVTVSSGNWRRRGGGEAFDEVEIISPNHSTIHGTILPAMDPAEIRI
jgi:hypothetical protein